MKKLKSTNKGITLIALVITIIVMLILVAVTITMAVNGGLFDYAGKATSETQNAIDAEQDLANGGVTIGNTYYSSIDEYLKEEEKKKEITFTIDDGYGKTYTAAEGMTWGEWIDSPEYDSGNYYYNENGDVAEYIDQNIDRYNISGWPMTADYITKDTPLVNGEAYNYQAAG